MTGSLSENGIVIGIYGISGVGKSYLLNQISTERIEWRVVDGSQLIREVLKERNQTMEDFERMTLADKGSVRKSAIETAKKKPGVTLVAGHCSFARNDCSGSDGESVTFNDVFMHISDVRMPFGGINNSGIKLTTTYFTGLFIGISSYCTMMCQKTIFFFARIFFIFV